MEENLTHEEISANIVRAGYRPHRNWAQRSMRLGSLCCHVLFRLQNIITIQVLKHNHKAHIFRYGQSVRFWLVSNNFQNQPRNCFSIGQTSSFKFQQFSRGFSYRFFEENLQFNLTCTTSASLWNLANFLPTRAEPIEQRLCFTSTFGFERHEWTSIEWVNE